MIGRYAELPGLAHRTEPDVRMMYELAVAYFRGTLQPAQRTQITHYMTLTCNKVCTKRSSHPQINSRYLNDLGHKDQEAPESGDEDKQVDGNRELDANFDEEEAQLVNEEWRMIMAQELPIREKDEEDEDDLLDGMKP